MTHWPDLEAALQGRPGWRRVGREYHGPCPVSGAGRDCCFASEGRAGGVAVGCRRCGNGGRLDSESLWKWQGEKGPCNVKRDPSVGCPSTRFLLSSVGRLVPLGGLEAVAVPVGRQHGGMVHDTVDDGRGGGRIQEHLGPAGERQIGCDDEAPALVAAADTSAPALRTARGRRLVVTTRLPRS